MSISIPLEDYEDLEATGKKNGLTPDEQAVVVLLKFFKAHDMESYDQAKKHVDPHVLEVAEKNL